LAAYNLSINKQEDKLANLALENTEALANDEDDGTSATQCFLYLSSGEFSGLKVFCDSRTSATTIYPCPGTTVSYFSEMAKDRCTN
jgi:hypothetical protein